MAQSATKLEQNMETACSLDDITQCPSARILKILLTRIGKALQKGIGKSNNGSEKDQNHNYNVRIQINQILDDMMSKHQYSPTKLLDDFYHLRSEHKIDDDDTRFDAAFDFFKECSPEKRCDITRCPLMRRHYRDRNCVFWSGDQVDNEVEADHVFVDTVAMIHCHLLHSFDINRLTKEERDRVEVQARHEVNADDEDDDINAWRSTLIAAILHEKQQKMNLVRGIRAVSRYCANDVNTTQSSTENAKGTVDFAGIAHVIGMREKAVRRALAEYVNDKDRFIGDVIDVLYGDGCGTKPLSLSNALKIEEDHFKKILHGHFKCTQLSTKNMVKISNVIVRRMEFQIDIDVLNEVITKSGIDGRIYDKNNAESYQSVGVFAQKFKSSPNIKGQHIRRLYNVIRKWNYIKSKKQKTVQQQNEMKEEVAEAKEDDNADEEKVNVSDDLLQTPTVYEIGKQFYFWDSLKGHPRFVKGKYGNMKEEVFNSRLLTDLVSVRAWNNLTKDIAAMIATEYALRISSNGISLSVYQIPRFEPLDAGHLRALKLYTDFDKLCAKFCEILRSGDPVLIEEIANLTRSLIEMVQCYGTPLSAEGAKKTYYRGVSRSFLFRTIGTKFNLPWSTTTSVKCR